MRTSFNLFLVFGVMMVIPVMASALVCGDDVDGERVACACGDVVVSDTRLRASDPVVVERCERDGLFVRASSGTRTLTLDLGGQSIRGNGSGTGIRVLSGGSEGAVITGGSEGSMGQVIGFYAGIKARGKRVLKSLSGVRVESSVRDGVVVDGVGSEIRDVYTAGNGGDGVRVGGRSSVAREVVSENNDGYGVRVRGRETYVEAQASGNGRGASAESGRDHGVSVEVAR
jgi:hypothetical protein